MRELLPTIDAWRAAGRGFGRAVLVRAIGNGPRPEGATLLAADDGSIAGSVSGGCVEGAAAELIAKARRDGQPRLVRFGISDEQAWGVGLACGSTIDVLIEPSLRAEVEAAARTEGASFVVTPLPVVGGLGGAGGVGVVGGAAGVAGVSSNGAGHLPPAAAELVAKGRSGVFSETELEYFVE